MYFVRNYCYLIANFLVFGRPNWFGNNGLLTTTCYSLSTLHFPPIHTNTSQVQFHKVSQIQFVLRSVVSTRMGKKQKDGRGHDQQISGCQTKVQKMARNPFRLRVQNSGTASQLTASKQSSWALLNSIFSYQMNVALLSLICFHFCPVLKYVILFLKVTFVFRFLTIFFIYNVFAF